MHFYQHFAHFYRNKNKNRGKSIRKRIQASFRRKSARDKQKKLDHAKQFQCEMEMPENTSEMTRGSDYVSAVELNEADSVTSSNGNAISNVTGNGNAVTRVRKTSKFLTVDEGLRHLSICEAGEEENESN